MIGALDEVHNGRGGDGLAGAAEWWFSFRTGEIEVPTYGLYTLPFGPGTTDETASFTAVIKRR